MRKVPKPKVITLIGQTASGKTSAAIKLAQAIGGEVISADSRQVYKHLNIGTDKVHKEAMQGVPHHLIDIADPLTDTYTVSDFVHDAQQAIADIHGRGKVPIVAGGTMLYIDSLFGNMLVPEVPPNEALRTELEQKGAEALFTELQKRDPRRAQQMIKEGQHTNMRRLVRALEVVEVLGHVPNPADLSAVESPYDILWLGMHNDPEVQKEKINTRNAEMLENGLLEEVAQLQKLGITPEQCKNFGFEYLYPALYLTSTPIIKDNPPTLEDVLLKMNSSTWRYAKKQRAWWAGRSEISWCMPSEHKPLLEKAVSFLSNKC